MNSVHSMTFYDRNLSPWNRQAKRLWNTQLLLFQKLSLSSSIIMPPKADYWRHFVVQGFLAVCQIAGCARPNVSLGSIPKNGAKKRISKYKLYIWLFLMPFFLQQLEQSQAILLSTMRMSGVVIVRQETMLLLAGWLSNKKKWKPARWKMVRFDSTMSGPAKVGFHFSRRWAVVDFFCFFALHIPLSRCYLT